MCKFCEMMNDKIVDWFCSACHKFLVPEDYPHKCIKVELSNKTTYIDAEYDKGHWSWAEIQQ